MAPWDTPGEGDACRTQHEELGVSAQDAGAGTAKTLETDRIPAAADKACRRNLALLLQLRSQVCR
ncbi:MAG: hypothetical protein ACYDHM_09875 [Acidiferrobacterales bacterium]